MVRCLIVAIALAIAAAGWADDLTPSLLAERLKKPDGLLAADVRSWFGERALRTGGDAKVDGLQVAWALEAPYAMTAPKVVMEDGTAIATLNRVGGSLYAASTALPEGTAGRWSFEIDGIRFGEYRGIEVYGPREDNLDRPGVPKGALRSMPPFLSRVFEGTTRDWWIYVPAAYSADKPACVMVFQDGIWAKNYVPRTFDNLIAKGDMPVTVAIFVSPGVFADGGSNRSVEYDTLSDRYARFLLDEILPEAQKSVKLRQDAEARAVAGISSGGICAWTVAWERPDQFSKVLSWVGSFVNLQPGPTGIGGGHNYPALIRARDRKPIRAYLQDGKNDLDNPYGNWPLANLQMDRALAFRGYDYRFVYGNGFHSDAHGRALLPDALRWLWRDVR